MIYNNKSLTLIDYGSYKIGFTITPYVDLKDSLKYKKTLQPMHRSLLQVEMLAGAVEREAAYARKRGSSYIELSGTVFTQYTSGS